MYHRIACDSFDPWGLVVTPARFEAQLAWLAEHREILRLSDFAARLINNDLPRRAVAITFDDGYECAADVAVPMLKRAGLPATIFIPPHLIADRRQFWWDELRDLIFAYDGDTVVVADQPYPLGEMHASDRAWRPGYPPRTARQSAFHRVWLALVDLPTRKIDTLMADLRRQCSHREMTLHVRPMSPAQVRKSARAPIEFGSHSLTHPRLSSLSSTEKRHEIVGSVEACERMTGSRPTTFAYPHGILDKESITLVEEAGYTCACAAAGPSVNSRSSVFALPRMHVGDWTPRELAHRLGAI